MRRRLLFVLVPLLAALLGALTVILAQTYADSLTQGLFIRRSAETEDFAAFAEPVLRTGTGSRGLAAALDSYTTDVVPGATVAVYNNDRELIYSNGPPPARALRARDASLAESDVLAPKTAWPWHRTPMIIGKTIGRPTIGAVVLEAPTARARASRTA